MNRPPKLMIVCRMPYASPISPNGIILRPLTRYGTVTRIPVEDSEKPYLFCIKSVPIAIIVNVSEYPTAHSKARSQKPRSN